ncbi:hypothetical protein FIBSPDRAFT_793627 [Athelia psychrophila]|uniref:C2 NT-type domain-containing protein n=1 Tax=Athelia psychrophila TaxID=1759441 RepID=A0A166FNA3_9AGAM|nr:hypothetical protein FIBSPDRAFT_793627 [Fibularhizoctonia sp. CBS 109695]
MPQSTASIHTSGSSSTGRSFGRQSSDSSRQMTPIVTQERSDTIKPAKKPRPQALTETFHPTSYASQRSTSTSSSGSNPSYTPSVGVFRSHIHQLMPRHALFHVRVNIHQLASVPLVKGEFGVRWKFKKTKSRKDHRRDKQDKEKGRGEDGQADSEDEDEHDHADDGSGDEAFPYGSHGSHMNNGSHLNIPAVVVSNGHHSTLASAASTRPASPSPSTYAQFLNSDWLPQSFQSHTHPQNGSPPIPTSLAATTPQEAFVLGRGMTSFLPLQDHNVSFERTLNVVVQMDVNRDTMDLLPNELKLVVMQRVIQGDIDAPHNPRLGAVYLNLAEYANAGPVTRRYLLSQSRTNATLKLTIELEHIGGEGRFKAPPLPKGEVLGGVAGILDNDVYRTRPRALDLYGMYYDTQGRQKVRPNKPSHSRYGSKAGTNASSSTTGPLDISSLSSAYGPHTTETLIEAIFNPVPSHEDKPSPFTYFVPYVELAPRQKDAQTVSSGRTGSESVRSLATSSGRSGVAPSFETRSVRSISSQGHGSVHASEFGHREDADAKRHWWRKLGSSRPSTPVM